jgi:ABC-type multidrug transport system ATPase subunit
VAEPPARLSLDAVSVVRAGSLVLDRVSVEIGRGEIVAVIGPNGAGKTTLLEAAIGSVPLTSGAVLVDGRAPAGLRGRAAVLAYLAGEAEPPHEVDVATIMDAAGGEPVWGKTLEAHLALTSLRSARAGGLSRGERRRLLLYEALSAGKPFVLLDEPTGVFDPLQLEEVVHLFRAAAARGLGFLVTVHQMSDAEALGARLVILNRGQVVATGALGELRTLAGLDAGASLQEVFLALLRRPEGRKAADASA